MGTWNWFPSVLGASGVLVLGDEFDVVLKHSVPLAATCWAVGLGLLCNPCRRFSHVAFWRGLGMVVLAFHTRIRWTLVARRPVGECITLGELPGNAAGGVTG